MRDHGIAYGKVDVYSDPTALEENARGAFRPDQSADGDALGSTRFWPTSARMSSTPFCASGRSSNRHAGEQPVRDPQVAEDRGARTGLTGIADDGPHARHYLGYFASASTASFITRRNDVLEELWLPMARAGEVRARYYQGLIQVAAGLCTCRTCPEPAGLRRAGFSRWRWQIRNVGRRTMRESISRRFARLCRAQRQAILDSGETLNPWSPARAPQLELPNAAKYGL